MEIQSRANYINSVASGQKIPCPICDCLNESGTMFCVTCGCNLNDILSQATVARQSVVPVQSAAVRQPAVPSQVASSQSVAMRQTVVEGQPALQTTTQNQTVAFQTAEVPKQSIPKIDANAFKTEEEQVFQEIASTQEMMEDSVNAFAKGLPDWSIVPPHVMVRRKKKK